MRMMSFSLTERQFKARTKTVTRRLGWRFLQPGDQIMGVRKAMGLKKGEKVKRLHTIYIDAVRVEPLSKMTDADCFLEGFPEFQRWDFIWMFCEHNGCTPETMVTRIEFTHL